MGNPYKNIQLVQLVMRHSKASLSLSLSLITKTHVRECVFMRGFHVMLKFMCLPP